MKNKNTAQNSNKVSENTGLYNLPQFSEFEKWLKEADSTGFEEELDEIITLGVVYGYDIIPDNHKNFIKE